MAPFHRARHEARRSEGADRSTRASRHTTAPLTGAGNRAAAALLDTASRHAVHPGAQRQMKRLRGDDNDPGPARKRRRLDQEGDWTPGGTPPQPTLEVDEEPEHVDDMEELISLFQQMSISFESEVDGEDHEVYPSLGQDDLIIASNPTPLRQILVQGHWLGVPLGAAVAQLTALAGTATTQLKTYSTARTQANAEALRTTMRSVGHLLKHLTTTKINLAKTDLSRSDSYRQTGSGVVGTHVIASPLSVRSDIRGSAPQKAGKLMTAIKNQAVQSGGKSKNFKQMHLLNDNVFGPGEAWNLTPGTPKSNVRHERDVETPLKRAIFEKGLVLHYEATVDYRKDPTTASDLAIAQNPDLYRFDKIRFVAEEYVYDATSQTFTRQRSTDNDVNAVDGYTLRWDWGGIKPLVPKPNILKCTNPDELIAIGVGKAVATRITNFNVARPAYHPRSNPKGFPGTKKREALIALISRFDGKKKMPAKSFDATKVYWTV